MSRRIRSMAPRFAAALALAGALALGAPEGHAGPGGAVQQVDARNQDLRVRVSRLKPTKLERLGGKKASTTRVVGHGDTVIFRRPSRGLEKGLRSNRVMQLLSTQLGDPLMVPPAVLHKLTAPVGEFAAGEDIMAMSDESGGFEDADRAPTTWRAAVSEDTRLIAATIDLLVQYRDRKLANVRINAAGKVRLIDPDSTFVSKSNKSAYRSQFYPGMELGYASKQAAFDDLPATAKALVRSLTTSSLASIQADYGVDASEAGVLQARAKDILERGLSAAVEAYVSTLTLKPAH